MSEKKMTSIGGQAVLEGVMMRGPYKVAVAVRKPDGEIVIDEKDVKGHPVIGKIPLVRGVFSFFSSMVIGVQAMMFSAKFFDEPEDEKKKRFEKIKEDREKERLYPKWFSIVLIVLTAIFGIVFFVDLFKFWKNMFLPEIGNRMLIHNVVDGGILVLFYMLLLFLGKTAKRLYCYHVPEKMQNFDENDGLVDDTDEFPMWAIIVSVVISLFLSIGLFTVLPNFLSNVVVEDRVNNPLIYNVFESVLKIGVFLGYMILVSQMRDMQRVFEYHGAEHKTIFCYENGEELTVENVKKYTRFHPRCGTSFLLFVVIVSIVVHMFLGVYEKGWINTLIRLLCLPLIAGISYEIIKFAGKSSSKCVAWLNAPGKWLQKFTTREPDDKQIEVAITSLKAVIPENAEDDKW